MHLPVVQASSLLFQRRLQLAPSGSCKKVARPLIHELRFLFLQMSIAYGQRVWNRRPEGGLIGLGTSPFRIIRSRFTVGSAMRFAESKAWVYGCFGLLYSCSLSASSTILPRYHGYPVGNMLNN